jgi:hypothetical protein
MSNAGTNSASFIFAWVNQVESDPKTSPSEFRLAWVISQMINKKTRVCWPLQATLAKRLGVSVRAVGGYISGLRERGHLRVRDRGRDSSSIYEPILQDRKAASGHDTGRPEETFRSCGDDQNEDRQSDAVRPEISRRKTGSSVPTEPVSVTSLNNHQERGAPQARRDADSLKRESVGNTGSLEIPMPTIVDDESGVAVAPPPDHLQRGVARARRLMQRGVQ